MGYEEETETGNSTPTPKLMLFSVLRQSPENPGRLTPPLYNMGSVPFRWEERPGKAIVVGGGDCINEKAAAVSKSLELPPRLLSFIGKSSSKINNKLMMMQHSPDTVLDGPFIMNRNTAEALSFRLMASSPDQEHRERALLSSFPWGSISRRRSLSFSYDDCSGSRPARAEIRRGRSLVFLSQARFWEKVCGGLKQLLQWKKRRNKKQQIEAPAPAN
ncbi:unnamed protein product [Rhodiola kirilowii]